MSESTPLWSFKGKTESRLCTPTLKNILNVLKTPWQNMMASMWEGFSGWITFIQRVFSVRKGTTPANPVTYLRKISLNTNYWEVHRKGLRRKGVHFLSLNRARNAYILKAINIPSSLSLVLKWKASVERTLVAIRQRHEWSSSKVVDLKNLKNKPTLICEAISYFDLQISNNASNIMLLK